MCLSNYTKIDLQIPPTLTSSVKFHQLLWKIQWFTLLPCANSVQLCNVYTLLVLKSTLTFASCAMSYMTFFSTLTFVFINTAYALVPFILPDPLPNMQKNKET
ncbi:hypothetical protein LINPERHAP1_LOCUS13210 [Linum perenne]